MYRIAIVEDQAGDERRLVSLLEQYAREENQQFSLTVFHSAMAFLEDYTHHFELVFMDIRLPGLDGMEAAHELRRLDHAVALVFLTSLAQYAVESYEVDAADYILKPVTAAALRLKLPRILARCSQAQAEVVIRSEEGTLRLKANELRFVEIYDHHIHFDTAGGVRRAYGTLKEIERALPDGFFRVNNQTIVNLGCVTRVEGESVTVAGRVFPISRGRRKEFLSALNASGLKI